MTTLKMHTPNLVDSNIDRIAVSTRPFPIATSKHEAKAHQYPYLYG